MHAKEQTLVQLLEGQKQYVVPLYQRTYSWLRPQLDQLWVDAMSQADVLRDEGDAPGHFLGSLVLAPTKAVVGGPQRWVVVDGQQRLTTLTLALAALRDHVRAESPRIADRIHRQFLVNEYLDGAERPKLVPTQDDRVAFAAVLEGDPGDATGNISDAYRIFREFLIGADDPDDPHDLARLEQALIHRLDLVAITADADDNVHRIFQSLNNTGMRLTQGDLLRNHYFMLLPSQADEVYQSVWRPMEKRLGVANLETLGLLDLLLCGYDKASRGDTYRLQADRIRPFESDEDAVAADVERLARRAESLAVVLDPAREPNPEIRRALLRLQGWGAEATHVVMLAALERLGQGSSTPEQVLAAASYTESYLVRRMLVGRTASGVNRVLAEAAREMLTAPDIAETLRRHLSAPRRGWPNDVVLRSEIQGRNFYWAGKHSQRMFVLRRLEESFPHREPVDWDSSAPTIEHVLPQALTPEWEQVLRDPDDPDLPGAEVHQMWVHRLGNLTVTGYNPELSNLPFTAKRSIYEGSHFEMTRTLAEQDEWGPAQIQARADHLADRAIRIWPAPLDSGAVAADDPWRVVRRILVAIPEGTWTSYGEICAVAGGHPVPLGSFLANHVVPNAWRVLTSSGKVSDGFRWADGRTDTAHEVLTGEGVRFDHEGTADPAQRLNPADLAELIGIDTGGDLPAGGAAETPPARTEAFWRLVRSTHPSEVVDGLTRMVEQWVSLGGTLQYGIDPQPVLVFILRSAEAEPWVWNVYPRGRGVLEIQFQYLKVRPPFDDTAKREHLRAMLDALPGVDVPTTHLGLRPRVPLALIGEEAVVEGFLEVQAWFVQTAADLDGVG